MPDDITIAKDKECMDKNLYIQTPDISQGEYQSPAEVNSTAREKDKRCSGFWVRFFALLLDNIPAGTLAIWIYTKARGTGYEIFSNNVFFTLSGAAVAAYAAYKMYFILSTFLIGATPGKRALRLRVKDSNGAERVPLWRIIFRETIGKYLSFMTLGLGYLMVLDGGRTLHDRLSDTRVEYD